MKSAVLATLGFAATALAAPAAAPVDPAPAINVTDVQVLQFAQTLEFLEAAFYKSSLAKFSNKDFIKAGFSANDRDQVAIIAKDEQTHVDFLTGALGNSSLSPCKYDFSSVTDPKSFLATAQVLEGVGTSAYLGAAKLITEKAYLQAAGSILTVEARHSSFINYALNSKLPAIPAAFDTPLGVGDVFTLAAGFIKSCPKNSTLPFKPFPPATIKPTKGSTFAPNGTFTVSYNTSISKTQGGQDVKTAYAAIISGPTSPTFVKIPKNKTIKLPASVTGQFYVVVVANNTSVDDDSTIAGPAVGFSQVPL